MDRELWLRLGDHLTKDVRLIYFQPELVEGGGRLGERFEQAEQLLRGRPRMAILRGYLKGAFLISGAWSFLYYCLACERHLEI